MSLLIDALRKAEQARREGEFQNPAQAEGGNGLALEPGPPSELPAAAPPELAAEFADPYAERAQRAASGADPRAARQLFEAKEPPQRRLFWPLAGAATTLLVMILGGYLWWELQPRGLVTASSPPPVASRPAQPAVTGAAPRSDQAIAPNPPVSEPTQAAPASPAPRREPVASRGSFAPPAPRDEPEAGGLGSIRRDRPADAHPPVKLADAYAAYQAGDLARAERLYGETLRQDPNNRDALDGLGGIALRRGREAEAEAWFRRSLAADPNDPVAQAGLADLRGRGQAQEGESRMRSLVAAQPEAAPGHFALGNALAAQDRWSEAQQAYFQAHTLDPDNPDYLFNLAVSLDRLRQPTLARRFYGEALGAADRRPAAFARQAAQARFEALDEAR